ncbi:hypothetical protein ACJW30_04G143200 [Castanea mollissima]
MARATQNDLHSSPPISFPFLFFYMFKCIRSSEKPNLLPSPPKLPIIGNLHQLGSFPHCPLMFLYFGQSLSLVVSFADMAREMMTTHDKVFSSRSKTIVTNFLLYGCIDLAFSPYGEYWRKLRQVCVHDLLSIKRVQSLHYVRASTAGGPNAKYALREEEVAILMNKVRDSCLNGVSINLSELLIETSNNIVTRVIFGKKFEEQDGMGKPSELPRKVMVLIASIFFWGDFFPSLGWIDILTGLLPSLKSTGREIDAYRDEVLEEHYKIVKFGDDEHLNKKDFVDILQKDGMHGYELRHGNLKAILLNMLIGGGDSTSTTLKWVMAELINNPSTMKRAQEEVRRVVGNKSKIDVDDISQMDYVKCIIKESLRLHTPLPLSAPRETLGSVKFGGYDIPEKTRVFVNVWAIQRDPKLWDRLHRQPK